MTQKIYLTYLYYIFIGLSGGVTLLSLFYWALTQTPSNLALLFSHSYSIPYYIFLYFFLTIGIAVLFGLNLSFFVYRWRKYGSPFSLKDAGSGIGAFFGLIASSCPICGTTILSTVGVMTGLSILPFQGLELKAGAIILMSISLWLVWRDTKKHHCSFGSCVKPRDHYLHASERYYVVIALLLFCMVSFIGFVMIRQDPVFTNTKEAHICPYMSD